MQSLRLSPALRLAVVTGALLLGLLLGRSPVSSEPGIYIVDNTSDTLQMNCLVAVPGDCTLRGAITQANIVPGQILFANFATPVIALSSPLPALVAPMSISPSAPPDGQIEIKPATVTTATNALTITGAAAQVRHLVINGFTGSGIVVSGSAAAVVIADNYIGVGADLETDKGNGGYGITIGGTAQFNTVHGNVIAGNTLGGVLITGAAHDNTISGNLIGISEAGNEVANSGAGIRISGAPGNTIGGDTTAARNNISGNTGAGIEITGATADDTSILGNRIGTGFFDEDEAGNLHGISVDDAAGTIIANNVISDNTQLGLDLENVTGTRVVSNFIGTDSEGALAQPNGIGIFVKGVSTDNDIGDPALPPNVISGNSSAGLTMSTGASGNRVMGNLIGVGADGNTPIGNGGDGIQIPGPGNTVGDGTEDGRNIIGANGRAGMLITGNAATGNSVRGNNIGVGADGVTNVGNDERGIRMLGGASENSVRANVIANNALDGISVEANAPDLPQRNNLSANSIYDNGELAIDLNDDGVTPNDATDADTGPNGLQNFPAIVHAYASTDTDLGQVRWTLAGVPTTPYSFHVYVSPACDPSGFGEGSTLGALGTRPSDSSGEIDTTTGIGSLDAGDFVTMTVTRNVPAPGETSEFSACAEVVAAPPATPTPTPATATPVSTATTITPTATATPIGTPTATPTGTSIGTGTATATPIASVTVTPPLTPTGTPSNTLRQGDVTCDGDVDEDDMLAILIYTQIQPGDEDPCPLAIGDDEPITGFEWGDLNCDGTIGGLDALFALLFAADLDTPEPAGECLPLGSTVA